MIKNQTALIVIAVLLLALLAGCGGRVSPAVTQAPEAAPASGTDLATPEPTAEPTPAPTETPPAAPAWIEEHELQFREAGAFSFRVDLSDIVAYEGSLFAPEEVANLSSDGEIAITRHSNDDGTKTITAAFTLYPSYLYRHEGYTTGQVQGLGYPIYGYLDLRTGELVMFFPWDEDLSTPLSSYLDGQSIELDVTHREVQSSEIVSYEDGIVQPYIAEVSVTCPAGYGDTAFFFQSGAAENLGDPEDAEMFFFRGEE